MSSGLYVRNRVLWIRQFIYMLLGSTSSQVKMLCIKFFCSSLQLSRLKVKKTECGGLASKWALFPYLEVGWHWNQKWQLYFISAGSALPSVPAVLVLPGSSTFHLRCSASSTPWRLLAHIKGLIYRQGNWVKEHWSKSPETSGRPSRAPADLITSPAITSRKKGQECS